MTLRRPNIPLVLLSLLIAGNIAGQTTHTEWLNQDAAYIITDDERKVFLELKTNQELEDFIERFWLRRDPTPGTVENEFKEEHYRRIAYANQHFATRIPGWKTDRGRIYIMYGPPDRIESHPEGGDFPYEHWRYRYIEDVGSDVTIEFVDPTMSGEYRMTMDPAEKEARLYLPDAGLTLMEQMGLTSAPKCFTRDDGMQIGQCAGINAVARLQPDAGSRSTRKFTYLESLVDSNLALLPLKVWTANVPLTGTSALTSITVQFENSDLNFDFEPEDGLYKAAVHIYGRIAASSGQVVQVFEDSIETSCLPELLSGFRTRQSLYQKSIPLEPGTYRLNLVAEEAVSGHLTNYERALEVSRSKGL